MGKFEIPWEYKHFPWDILKSHGIFIFLMEHKSPVGIEKVIWEIVTFPWDLKISQWKTNNPMGKFNFPLEFTPLLLTISPARCEQVKSRVVFTMLNLVYNMTVTVFLFVGLKASAFKLPKLFWQN